MKDATSKSLSTEQEEFLRKAKINAIIQAPTRHPNDMPLTATERVLEAEIIYLWLIKDVVT